jgi:hypothetical protein
MGKRPLLFILLIAFAISACDPGQGTRPNAGPQLLQDVTLAPTTPAPTRILSATPSAIAIPVITSTSASELFSPLEVSTLEADFVLVTPTLPPSKTPTVTPTQTSTFTRTPVIPPTFTPGVVIVTAQPISTIQGLVPIPTAVTNNIPSQTDTCPTPWFFNQFTPPGCPMNPPLVTDGSFEQFQKGYMIWIGQQDAIYVLYDSANIPRWQVFNDAFEDGMPSTDPAYDSPPPYTWQPKRGFGLLWRAHADVRERLGWAVIEWETPYEAKVQTASDGTIYVSDVRGGVFALSPNGNDWKRYE